MLIAARIKQLLDTNKIVYRVLPHQRSFSLADSIRALQLDPATVLVAEVLTDQQGTLLAVHSSITKIDLPRLNNLLQRDLKVLAEISANRIFVDCEANCWPPIGHPYSLDVIIDKNIQQQKLIYINPGCRSSLLQLELADYLFLNKRVRFLDFVRQSDLVKTVTQNPATTLHSPDFSHVVISASSSITNTLELWRHAFYAAEYARKISTMAATTACLDPELSYKAGLYHNFGMFLLSQMFNPEYKLLQKWIKQNPKVSVAILEQRLLGMGSAFEVLRHGHAKLGENLLRHWGMPEEVCVVAREHHNPNYNDQYSNYVKIIQIANTLLREQGIGDGLLIGLAANALQALGLQEVDIRAALQPVAISDADIMKKAQALI
jgi:prolyl-tRNA editing enzyme YbaK/EbsC (Cys-tRNA(Pro) deacylase)